MRARLALSIMIASWAVVAAGCADLRPEPLDTPAPVAPRAPPPPPPASEFAWSTAPGRNTIQGEIAYADRVGRRWVCAGQSVALMPRTPSTDLRMQALYGSSERALEPVAEVRAHSGAVHGADPGPYVRTTACDSDSRFAFNGLPDGVYFLIARVHLERIHQKGATAADADGLAVMQRVAVSGGVVRQLTLPLRNRP